MKSLLVTSALALSAVLFAVPISAHHNSPISEELEETIPEDALARHNEAVEDVLEMGVAEMLGEAQGTAAMSGELMDPADDAEGNTCTEVLPDDGVATDCGPGNEEMDGYGMDRGILPVP